LAFDGEFRKRAGRPAGQASRFITCQVEGVTTVNVIVFEDDAIFSGAFSSDFTGSRCCVSVLLAVDEVTDSPEEAVYMLLYRKDCVSM